MRGPSAFWEMLFLLMSLQHTFINEEGKEEKIYREYAKNYTTLFNEEAEIELIKSLHRSEAMCKLIKYVFDSRHFISIRENYNTNECYIEVRKDDISNYEFFVSLGKITSICCYAHWQYVIRTEINSTELLDLTFDAYFQYLSQLRKAVKDKANELFQNLKEGSVVKAFVAREEFDKTSNLIFEIDESKSEIITYDKKCKFIIDNKTEVPFELRFNKEKNEFFIDSLGSLVPRDEKSREVLYII